MMRLAVVALALLIPPAAESAQTLSLVTARGLVARSGVNVGTVFTDEAGRRFLIAQVRSSSPSSNTFVVTVRVRPLD